MVNNIQISFNEEVITIKSNTSTNQFANLIAIDSETDKIVEVGQTEKEVSAFNPKRWAEEKHKIIFKPIYEWNKFNAEDIYLSIWALLLRIYKNRRFLRKLSCSLDIPRYELYPKDMQQYFEYSTQSMMKFRSLSINGSQTPLSGKKLTFAKASLEYGRWIGFALFLYIAFTNVDFLTDKFGFYYLILLFASIGIGIWTVEVIWLVFMKFILPKNFVRLIFQEGYGIGGWSTSRTLANLILGKNK